MVLGIVSDTHGYFHPALPEAFKGVDRILHAGDLGTEEILDKLERIAPVDAVFGNVDGAGIRNRCPEVLSVELGGVAFLMMHISGRPGRLNAHATTEIRNNEPDVFICGHSHILQIQRIPDLGNLLFVNPGAAGKQGLHRIKTCVRLSIRDGKPDAADVVHLDELIDA